MSDVAGDSGASSRRTEVLGGLSDSPLHVEARGLLLCRHDAVLILDPVGVHGFVFAAEHGMAIGFGRPSVDLMPELRDIADARGMVQEGLELHLPIECADDWLALECATSMGQHRVQVQEGEAAEPLRHASQHETAVLASKNDPLLETLPRALRAEFAAMRPWPTVVASLAGECIASIASAFVETEAYFDVSIDTVRDFRRSGFGSACARALIDALEERGKRPVWMVHEKNHASVALSRALGFRDVGRVQGLRI